MKYTFMILLIILFSFFSYGCSSEKVADAGLKAISKVEPMEFLPEKCTIGSGFECESFDVTNEGIILNIKNNLGSDAIFTEITSSSGDADKSIRCTWSGKITIGKDDSESFRLSGEKCTKAELKTRKMYLTATYYNNDPSFSKSLSGDLFFKS